jgi:glycosyltransferase involved in cell wall biosynthesis
MKNILISGPLLSNSGYGVHCRQIFSFLIEHLNENEKLHCNITSWGNSSWHLSNETTSGLFDEIIQRHIPESLLYNIKYSECYSVGYPTEWIFLGDKNIGITAGVETNIVPRHWLEHIKRANMVIVPSEFTKSAFLNSFDNVNNIKVVPEYFYEELIKENNDSIELLKDIKTTNNLLVIGQITSRYDECDRKNIINTIESSLRVLSFVKDSGLILKLNSGNNSYIDFEKVSNIINPIVKNIKKELKEKSPKVYILHGNLTIPELKTLYTEKTSALLSLSKGEGFGLTLLEAAVCECPIIATDYSAYTEFLGDNFIKIDYELKCIPDRRVDELFIENSVWAIYKDKSLHMNVVKFFNNKDKYINMAKKLKLIIESNFNKDSIFKIYKKCLK